MTLNIWLDDQKGYFGSDFCLDMLQKWLLKITVEADVFGFKQYSTITCPEQACGFTQQLFHYSVVQSRQYHANQSLYPLHLLTVLMDQRHDPVSNSDCSSTCEILWSCIVLLLWKNASEEMPLLTSPSFQTHNARDWSQCLFSLWTAITSTPEAHRGPSWYQN